MSYTSGERMVKYSVEKILSMILDKYDGKKIYILAPLVKNRKGHYKTFLSNIERRAISTCVLMANCAKSHSA